MADRMDEYAQELLRTRKEEAQTGEDPTVTHH